MHTRGKSGFVQPVDRLNLGTEVLSPLPASFRSVLGDPNWRAAMQSDFNVLQASDTWTLVPRPPGVNVVTGKWVYRHKFLTDGTLDCYKAHWVLRSFTQRPGIDYDETFSSVMKPATIRVVLSLALSRSWLIHELDVKNAFLHGTLTETVYCAQPFGFVDTSRPDYVYRLNRSLYGLKQTPSAWHSQFASHITFSVLWRPSLTHHCSFTVEVLKWPSYSCMLIILCSQPRHRVFFSRSFQLFVRSSL